MGLPMAAVFRFLIWTALVLGALGLILHHTVLRAWRVPVNDPVLEASLAPTLRSGDLVLLWRLTEPALGDLVVCPEPDYPERVVVGRVFGESGDVIRFDKGQPQVNGDVPKFERRCAENHFEVTHPDDESKVVRQQCRWEEISNRIYMIGSTAEYGTPRDWEDVQVPPGHVYLVSDNRLFPYDSRDYGPVLRETCKETVVFRLVSREGWGDSQARMMVIQ